MQFRRTFPVALIALLALSGAIRAQPTQPKTDSGEEEALRAAKWLQEAFKGQPTTEAADMLIAIAKGSKLGPGEGWFKPGQTRCGWRWIAEKHGVKTFDSIAKKDFQGPEALFARLDRNKDGQLRADDFDWSDRTFHAQQSTVVGYWFRRVNLAADGKLTKEEWLKFYEEAAKGKDHVTLENLREAVTSPPPGAKPVAMEMPSAQTLVRGLFRGEIGSMNEGPKLNDPAPDFSLKTRDGKETIRLSDHLGKKPVVLMFGNFTCGPFRSVFPRVDEIAVRCKNDAAFFGVYVREAHPTDGWRMGSNDESGVAFAQPKDYVERTAMAERCFGKLKMSFPLLVDEMDDRVGHAYSGMPARLYVIDKAGRIAYKSGRGPFGFKPEEMEQTLTMLLLEQHLSKRTTTKATEPDGK